MVQADVLLPGIAVEATALGSPEIRPEFSLVDSCPSMALYGTVARSLHAAVSASRIRPSHK